MYFLFRSETSERIHYIHCLFWTHTKFLEEYPKNFFYIYWRMRRTTKWGKLQVLPYDNRANRWFFQESEYFHFFLICVKNGDEFLWETHQGKHKNTTATLQILPLTALTFITFLDWYNLFYNLNVFVWSTDTNQLFKI